MITQVSNRYNKQHEQELGSKGAAKKFLNPVGLYDQPITYSFSNDASPIPDERAYFKAFHFVKFRLCKAQKEGSKRVEFWYQMFTLLRNRLVSGNMGLVYDCINKSTHANAYRDKTEFVSACSMILIRSVECFDPWRGPQFSTYAGRAILYRCSYVASFLSRPPALDIVDVDVPDKSQITDVNVDFLVDRIRVAISRIRELTDQEKTVLHMRFFQRKILSQVGDHYGVTKERVRQIQNNALAKIREELKKDKTLDARLLVSLNSNCK